jgi:predicted nucleic acid-binding protein
VTACIDSDVLIDYFDGIPAAAEELSRYEDLVISRITWMEVLVGAPTEDLSKIREGFLRQFSIVELDERIARDAIGLRQERRLKLPDAIIWASARLNDALLVTRNAKDFPAHEPGVRIPYKV